MEFALTCGFCSLPTQVRSLLIDIENKLLDDVLTLREYDARRRALLEPYVGPIPEVKLDSACLDTTLMGFGAVVATQKTREPQSPSMHSQTLPESPNGSFAQGSAFQRWLDEECLRNSSSEVPGAQDLRSCNSTKSCPKDDPVRSQGIDNEAPRVARRQSSQISCSQASSTNEEVAEDDSKPGMEQSALGPRRARKPHTLDNPQAGGEELFTAGEGKRGTIYLDYGEEGPLDPTTAGISSSFDTACRSGPRISRHLDWEQEQGTKCDSLNRGAKEIDGVLREAPRPNEAYRSKTLLCQDEQSDPGDAIDEQSQDDCELQLLPPPARAVSQMVYDETSCIHLPSLHSPIGVFRHRLREFAKNKAFTFIDGKGRTIASHTYRNLGQRVECIYDELLQAKMLQRGDRVCLYYRRLELSEFVPALLAVLAAGFIAVPIVLSGNSVESDISELFYIIESTRTKLVLTTDYSTKTLQKELSNRRQELPSGCQWWKTNEVASSASKNRPADNHFLNLQVHPDDIAYIDFTKSPMAELRGVVITHGMIMHNCNIFKGCSRLKNSDVLVSSLDSRQVFGLFTGVFSAIYCGYHSVLALSSIVENSPAYFSLLNQVKATALLMDYAGMSLLENGLLRESNSNGTAFASDLDCRNVEKIFLDAQFLDPRKHDTFFASIKANNIVVGPACEVVPVCTVPELGGLIVAMRDELGYPLDDNEDGDLLEEDNWELLLDREAIRQGKVVIFEADTTHIELKGTLRTQCCGFVYPEAQVAIVSMEGNKHLCEPNCIGEIWFSAPFMQGAGLFGLPKQSESLFKARPIQLLRSGAIRLEADFVRTGLVGCLIDGVKLLVLGTKRERIKQITRHRAKEEGEIISNFFSSDISRTIAGGVDGVHECCTFPVLVNHEHLPVAVIESTLKSDGFEKLVTSVLETARDTQGVNLFAIAVVPANSLQRWKNGVINTESVRRSFELGALKLSHIALNTKNTINNLPKGNNEKQVEPRRRAQIVLGPEFSSDLVDDRYGMDLSRFRSITDILVWRAETSPDDLACTTLDFRGKESKTHTFKKLSQKVSTFAQYLTKKGLRTGQHVLLLFTLSSDYWIAVHTCLYLGLVGIVLPPPDMNRLREDIPALLNIVDEYEVQALLVNGIVEELLKSKQVQSTIKLVRSKQQASTTSFPSASSLASGGTQMSIASSASMTKTCRLPQIINNARAGRTSSKCMGEDGLRDRTKNEHQVPRLVLVHFNADMQRAVVALSQATLLHQCRVLKDQCGMKSSSPVLSCVRTYHGVGLLHAVFMGVYLGSLTIYIPPFEFSSNPQVWFDIVQSLKVKDTVATYPMLQHAMRRLPAGDARNFSLQSLQDLMIILDDRPNPIAYQDVVSEFAANNLRKSSIANTYGPLCDPLISTRAYVDVEQFSIHVDTKALRRGRVEIVPDNTPGSLLLQDSGKPPADTMIAIVDPFTRRPLSYHEVGEIWVASPANIDTYYGRDQEALNAERFDQLDTDPRIRFARTGDLGFLHPHQVLDESSNPVDGMLGFCLFVLGSMMDAFQMNGLTFFPSDIETTIESSHPSLLPNSCVALKLDEALVICVELAHEEDIHRCVPVICMSVLEEHQLVIDTIAFVKEGMLAKSRLHEKQRAKIAIAYSIGKLPVIQVVQLRHRGAN